MLVWRIAWSGELSSPAQTAATLLKDLNKLKVLYQGSEQTGSLFKGAVSIGRRNCSTNEAKNKLFSGAESVAPGRGRRETAEGEQRHF